MKELFRDTVAGHLVRYTTRGKVLQYVEERDPSLWKRYVDKVKSGRMAHHGHTGEEEKPDEKQEEASGIDGERQSGMDQNGSNDSRESQDTRVGSQEHTSPTRNEASGVVVDPEKGRDATIVTWFSDDDPEVCYSDPTPSGL